MSNELVQRVEPPILVSDLHGVRTLRFNRPNKLNGWSPALIDAIGKELFNAKLDDSVKAVILTSTGRYYSAGVDFAGSGKLMHPRTFKQAVVDRNEALFNFFIDFPKPLIAATNGPAIGAAVTSLLLCDAVVASETSTYLTPFKSLGLVPEGCSSFTYPKRFGIDLANELLEGKMMDANHALEIGFADYVVPNIDLQDKAQSTAEEWVASNRPRRSTVEGTVEKLKETNARESIALADAMMDYPFLDHMVNFTYSKAKYVPFLAFYILRSLRPIWSRL